MAKRKPKVKTMDFVAICRSPARRQIMIVAQEAQARGEDVTALGISQKLDWGLSKTSYHTKQLVRAGALRETHWEQVRGAMQRHYVPSEAFQVQMTDTVALDRIAELVDGKGDLGKRWIDELRSLIRATGRPVEA